MTASIFTIFVQFRVRQNSTLPIGRLTSKCSLHYSNLQHGMHAGSGKGFCITNTHRSRKPAQATGSSSTQLGILVQMLPGAVGGRRVVCCVPRIQRCWSLPMSPAMLRSCWERGDRKPQTACHGSSSPEEACQCKPCQPSSPPVQMYSDFIHHLHSQQLIAFKQWHEGLGKRTLLPLLAEFSCILD